MATTKNRVLAAEPAAEFEHRDEIVRILRLACAQIQSAVQQSDQAVSSLGDAFASILDCEDEISRELMQYDALDSFAGGACDSAARLGSQTRSAIVALQFYDRLSQRLDHVAGSLELLGDLLARDEDCATDSCWRQLHSQIRSRCSMHEERELFERIYGKQSETVTEVKPGSDFESF